MNKKQKEQQEAVDILKGWGVLPGTKIYGNVTHVSRSGMSRNIRLSFVRDGDIVDISYWAAKVIGWTYKDGYTGGVRVGGCGMNMILHTIDCLSYGMGYGTTNQARSINNKEPLPGLRGNY